MLVGMQNGTATLDAGCRMLGAGAPGWPRGMVVWGKVGEGFRIGNMYTPWQIHVDVWQNQYNIVKTKIIMISKILKRHIWKTEHILRQSSNCTLRYLLKQFENLCPHKICMQTYSSFINNCSNLDSTKMCFSRGMGKLYYSHTLECFSY